MYPPTEDEQDNDEKTNSVQLMPADVEALQWFFNYDSIFLQIEASLRGRQVRFNSDAKCFEIDMRGKARPLMNEHGIQETMSYARAMITQIEAFSVFTDHEIRLKYRRMNIVLIKLYATKMQAFDMTNEQASFVIRMLMDKYDANLRKSLDGASMELTRGTMKTSYVKTKDDRGGGFLGFQLPKIMGR